MMRSPCRQWMRSGALVGLAFAAAAATARADTPFETAIEHYEQSHWLTAYEGFATLADQGHIEAARIALLMRRQGQVLYNASFSASPAQLEGWMALAIRQHAVNAIASPRPKPGKES